MIETFPATVDGWWAGDGVEVVLVASSGQARVPELGVQRVVAEEERDVAREALTLVDGAGVAVLQVLGDHFTSPVFIAALELWVAARTDPALLAEVAPLEQQVGRETHRMTVELLGVDEAQPGVRALVQATLDLVRGLGLANTISDDTRRRNNILDHWAAVIDTYVERA